MMSHYEKLREFAISNAGSEHNISTSELVDFSNRLTDEELLSFLRAILLEERDTIKTIFEDTKIVSAEEIAFDWLVNLPTATLYKATRSLEIIMDEALDVVYEKRKVSGSEAAKVKPEQAQFNEVIKKIKALVARKKIGLSVSYLKHKVKLANIPYEDRIGFWLLLSGLDEFKLDNKYLEDNIDVQSTPQLTPVLISSFATVNPEKSLQYLMKLDGSTYKPVEVETRYFKSSVKAALLNFLKPDFENRLSLFWARWRQVKSDWIEELYADIARDPRYSKINQESTAGVLSVVGQEDAELISKNLHEQLEQELPQVRTIAKQVKENSFVEKLSHLFKEGEPHVRFKLVKNLSEMHVEKRTKVIDGLTGHDIVVMDESHEYYDKNNWEIRCEIPRRQSEIIKEVEDSKSKHKELLARVAEKDWY